MEIVSSSFNLANVVEVFSCKGRNRLRTSKELTEGSYRPYLGREGDEIAGILLGSRPVVLRFEVRVKFWALVPCLETRMVVVWCLKLSEKVVVRQRDKDEGKNERGEGGSVTERA